MIIRKLLEMCRRNSQYPLINLLPVERARKSSQHFMITWQQNDQKLIRKQWRNQGENVLPYLPFSSNTDMSSRAKDYYKFVDLEWRGVFFKCAILIQFRVTVGFCIVQSYYEYLCKFRNVWRKIVRHGVARYVRPK